MRSPIERFLDSPRNPWAYTWRCAVHGHDLKDSRCRRCGLRRLLADVVVAADRMRDDGADADDAVKKSLWTKLHTAAEAAYGEVYPLPAETTHNDGPDDA